MDVRERVAEIVGKSGIIAAPASEIAERQGVFDSLTTVQYVSMAGVVWLMVERTNKGLLEAKEHGRTALILSSIQWLVLWSLFISFFWVIA